MPDFARWDVRHEYGATVYERRDDFRANVFTGTPHIHAHYFTTDEQLAEQGWAFMHLVCHECNRARLVIYPDFDDAEVDDADGLPLLAAERDRFIGEHREHRGLYSAGGGYSLCPPQYEVVDTVNFRERTD